MLVDVKGAVRQGALPLVLDLPEIPGEGRVAALSSVPFGPSLRTLTGAAWRAWGAAFKHGCYGSFQRVSARRSGLLHSRNRGVSPRKCPMNLFLMFGFKLTFWYQSTHCYLRNSPGNCSFYVEQPGDLFYI
jgi:hypothetical protein